MSRNYITILHYTVLHNVDITNDLEDSTFDFNRLTHFFKRNIIFIHDAQLSLNTVVSTYLHTLVSNVRSV